MGKALKPTQTKDLDKALAATGMDYEVEVWDSIGQDPLTGRQLANRKGAQIVRPVDGELVVIGQTGRRFTPIQNPDAFGVATDLIAQGATIEGLADIRHGAASVISLDLHRDVDLVRPDGGTDTTRLDLLILNAHDGNSALTFALTPVRMACTNVLPAAIKGAERVWKIAHTPNAAERVALAREAIVKAAGFQEAFTVHAQAMMDQAMVDAEFAKIVTGFVGVKPDATGKVADRKRETAAAIMDLYQSSPTLEGIRGTVWGGYNAITEYMDHYRPVKGNAALARAEGQIDGPNVRHKVNVFRQFSLA